MRLWGDPRVTRLFDRRGRLGRTQVAERLDREMACHEEHGVQYWPLFELATEEFVGCCGLRPYDPDRRVYEVGVHLLPAYWGRGLAEEVVRAVVEHGFSELGARAIVAGHHPRNERSRRLVEKLGFRYLRDELYSGTGAMHRLYEIREPASPGEGSHDP